MAGGGWNIGCWIFKTHGDWVHVGERGLVDEIVAVWNSGVVWSKVCSSHEIGPGPGLGPGGRATGRRAAGGQFQSVC